MVFGIQGQGFDMRKYENLKKRMAKDEEVQFRVLEDLMKKSKILGNFDQLERFGCHSKKIW